MDRATAGAIDTAQERAAHAARDAVEDAGGAGADEQAAGVGHGRSVRGAARKGDGGTVWRAVSERRGAVSADSYFVGVQIPASGAAPCQRIPTLWVSRFRHMPIRSTR